MTAENGGGRRLAGNRRDATAGGGDRANDPASPEQGAASLPATKDRDASLSDLGARIRELRRQQKKSLAQLSKASETSVAMLSHIERGETQPSLKTLDRVRQALGVPMTRLFPHSEEDKPDQGVVVRSKAREKLAFPHIGLVKHKLSPTDESELEVFLLELEPGGSSGVEPWARVGEKAGLVLKGGMQLDVGGEVYDLSAGDSFQFDSSKPHRFANPGSEAAEIVWIIKSSRLARQLAV
jgi:transcriptional regulator with XRE-family HTH domain